MKLPVKTLGELCEVAAGGGAPQDRSCFASTGRPFIRAGSLISLINGKNENKLELIPDDIAKIYRLRLFPPGIIVFAKSGMSATKGLIYKTKSYCYVVNHLAALIPHSNLDAIYLKHFLMVYSPVRLIRDNSYPSIRLSDIANIDIPYPSLPEQQRIAAILDTVDTIRQKRQEAIRGLEALRHSIFVDIFGNPPNTHGWPVDKLSHYLSFLTSGSRGWARYYAKSGSMFVRIQNVEHGRLLLDDVAYVTPPQTAETRRTRIHPGDVLLSITADLGRTGVVPEGIGDAYINQHLAILRVRDIDSIYLAAYLSSPAGQKQILKLNRHGVKAGLNFDDIRNLSIMVPPPSLQLKYRIAVEGVEQLRRSQYLSSEKIQQLYSAVQARAFQGEL